MPNFTYKKDIPFASHNPSSDQPIMQTNTNSTSDLLAVDHYGFNDNLGGYHKVVHFPNQGSTPALPSGVGFELLGIANNLIFANAQIPTGVFLTQSNAPPIVASQGRTFLAGAMVMEWGNGVTTTTVAPPTLGSFSQNFITPFSTIFCYQAMSQGSGFTTNVAVFPSEITVFVRNNGAPINGIACSWLVIGIL